MFSQNAKLLTLTLVSAIALSSCGKKKELTGGEAPAPATTTPAPAAGGNEADPSKDNANRGRDNGSVEVLPPLPPLPNGELEEPRTSGGKPPVANLPSVGGSKSPATPVKPPQGPQVLPPVISNPNSPAAREEFKSVAGKKVTGMAPEKGLSYTSAGADETLEYFKNLNKRQTAMQQQMNMKKATEILSAELTVDEESLEARILLTMSNGQKYKLAGAPEGDGRADLAQLRSNGMLQVKGFHKCIDTDGGCNTSYAKLQFSDGSYARIVFRQARASYKFNLPAAEGNDSQAHVLLEKFIINGHEKADTIHKLSKIDVSSFEVVNGRSGVTVEILGDDDNLIKFAGPLLAPEGGTVVNTQMFKIIDLTPSEDLMSENMYVFDRAKGITDIRMIRNNGLGQMRFALRTKQNDAGRSKVIEMTLSPVAGAAMSTQDIANFESTIK